jgi:3-methyladenine DNA glycosylase AlkD
VITKIADVPDLVPKGRTDPVAAFREIRALAASKSWQEREVAATALVEISKKHADARRTPDAVVAVLELLRGDADSYVRKSVANVLRNAGKRHPAFILNICRRWATVGDPHTDWIVKDGLRQLRESEPEAVARILNSLGKRRVK